MIKYDIKIFILPNPQKRLDLGNIIPIKDMIWGLALNSHST